MSRYLSNSEADLYFESRLDSELWDTISETDKDKLEATARRLLNALNYSGDKHSPTQDNEFPRGEDTVVPTDIKNACCEVMFALLDGRSPEYEREMLGQQTSAATGISYDTDPDIVDVARLHNIPSNVAWNMLRPYLRDGSAITLVRVN